MKRRHFLYTVPAALGLGLAGCGLGERAHLERRDWPLTVTRPEGGGGNGRLVLLLRQMQAGPGMEARGLQGIAADGSARVEFYESWSVPPAQGAEAALRAWLEASGRFAAVLAPGSRMNPDLILETTLTTLLTEPAGTDGPPRARAGLSLVVLDQRAGQPRLRAQRALRGAAMAEAATPPARAAAMRAALADVFSQAERLLAELA